MRKKGGFTLIEMLIVIVVMGVLFAMTLGFGASRVKDLDRQSVSDLFVDSFTTAVGQSRSSSYFYGHKYHRLLIHFASGADQISTSLSGADSSLLSPIFSSSTFRITRILVGQNTVDKVRVELTPYAIGCQIFADDTSFSGATIVANVSNQDHCYRLETGLCTLKKFACQ